MTRIRPRLLSLCLAGLLVPVPGCQPGEDGITHRPPTFAEPELTLGRQVFMGYCQGCHPGGGQGVGPSLIRDAVTEEHLRLIIRAGPGAMPAFSPAQLDDEEIALLAQFLDALRLHYDQP